MIKKYLNPENLQTALDCAVRDAQNEYDYGYTNKGVTYCNYMSEDAWQKYLDEKFKGYEHHKKQFDDGAGGELKEGKYPPKMASFGSSSRFIFELSKDIDGFGFEEKLDTRVGGIAHLDGSRKKDSEYIYIEAKKREIYGDSHKNEDIKEVYLDVYKHIKKSLEEKNFLFLYDKMDSKEVACKKVTFKIQGKDVQYFDLKQLICHFLGITYDIAKHSIRNIKVKFLYLIYNPQEVIKEMKNGYKGKIEKRYDEVTRFINNNIENGVFNAIFQAVLDYQIKKQNLDNTTKIEFKMKLVNQYNYQKEF